MTVSPRRPNDPSPAASGRSDQVAPDYSQSDQMPPTLFRLPNLNAASAGPASPRTASTIPSIPLGGPPNDQATPQATSFDERFSAPARQQAGGFAPEPLAESSAIGSEVGPVPVATDASQGTDGKSSEPHSVFPNIVPTDDGPAGRSWMEVTRQHGVVVVLLLIVVATAVFTGRDLKPPVEPTEASLAEVQEPLDIDTGVAADIPLPSHTHDLDSGVASSVDQPVVPPATDSVSLETPPAEPAANEPKTAVAALQPPQATASPTGIDLSGQDLVDGAAWNAKTAVETKAVSSRTSKSVAVSDSDFAVQPPSLETLAESLPDADDSAGGQETTDHKVPVKTNTPLGISNWLQYLPADSPQPSN